MRCRTQFASIQLTFGLLVGCGNSPESTSASGDDPVVTDGGGDASAPTIPADSALVTASPADGFSAPIDSTPPDTARADTETPDSETPDSEAPDTGPLDTGPPCTVGAACDDGDKCTTGEVLDSACVCGGGSAVTCDDSNVCTTDSCDVATGCKFAPLDGTSCGAGKRCELGICTSLCTVGASCDDGDACTTGETFNSACACTGTSISCDDGSVCTTDSCSSSSGCVFAPVADGTGCGSGKVCDGGACVEPGSLLPTVKISAPAALTKKSFLATGAGSDVCNALPFTLTVSAPKQIQTLTWHFFTPTATQGMTGDVCGAPTSALPPWRAGLGTPIYGHMIDPTKYGGMTTATFTENVSVSGLSSGGLWLWCTEPGTSGTAFLTSLAGTAIPGPDGGLTPLSRYCHARTLPADTDTAKQWTLLVQLTDKSGQKATDELKFWIYAE